MKKNIICPECGKVLCKADEVHKIENIYMWCKQCKKEIKIENRA